MKAAKSDLAKRMMLAGIRFRAGVPVFFEGKWYMPTVVPRASSL